MYQGKFESKSVAARAAKRAQEEQPKQGTEEVLIPPAEAPVAAAPKTETPKAAAPKTDAPKKDTPKKEAPQKEKPQKKVQTHTIVFYSLYFLFIAAFFVGLFFAMDALDGFLIKYEASQPDVKSREVFERYFASPDWAEIYDLTDLEPTAYDGKESFVSYMENKVTGELTFVETSMGLSQDKKFLLRQGDEEIGFFTLTNSADAVAIPEWELVSVEIHTQSLETVTVHSYPGYTVKINGVALTDDHVIRSTSTNAEKYLPEGLHGMRTVSYFLDGLMVAPTVTVENGDGEAVTLTQDPETGAWSHETTFNTISDEQVKAIDTASEIYGRFMITNVGKGTLAKYFKGNSYDSIIQAELLFIQDYSGYALTDTQITEFYSYSDTFCSARVQRTLNVTRGNGTIKPFHINTTFFLEKQGNQWIVVEMTNADVQTGSVQVRLRFFHKDEELERQMLDSDVEAIYPPDVDIPEGKKLVWCTRTVDETGKFTYEPVFETTEYGEIFLANNYELKPMDLHAIFVKEEE